MDIKLDYIHECRGEAEVVIERLEVEEATDLLHTTSSTQN
jgi:hypothetical protein